MDLGDPASIESGLGEIAEVTRGRLSGLVNCAGVNPSGRFEELKVGDWEQAFAVNVVGAYLMMVGCAPLMRANGGGAVVNVSSAAGKVPSPFQASYGASKAALISLTRSAAVALAPQIRVNSVCPGIVDTPLWQRLDARMESLGASLRFATRAAQAPAGRPALADEVAMVIAFLLSNDAVFITGEDVNVSGGLVMY
jgi:3-oxoacyl-[acyl-carrier protein] reductase